MKKSIVFVFMLVFVFGFMGCGNIKIQQPTTYTDSFEISTFDLSGVKSIQIGSGSTGNRILLTEQKDIETIITAVKPLMGTAPVSSRGFYGWDYDFMFYETASPNENDEPLLTFSLHIYSNRAFITHGVYEVVEGHTYRAMYTANQSVVEKVVSVCSDYIE